MQAGALWSLARGLRGSAAIGTRSIATAPALGQEPKQLFAACVLERLPVVIPEEEPFAYEYASLKDHLFKRYKQQVPAEFTKVLGDEAVDEVADQGSSGGFQPAPRVTEADHKKDTKSLHRALDRRLFLLVKDGTPSSRGWRFPQKGYEQEGTIRQTAESALDQALAESQTRQVYFVGNSPAGHREHGDAMTFYHRAQLIKGDVALRGGTASSDYVWVTKAELPEYIEDEVELKLCELILSQ